MGASIPWARVPDAGAMQNFIHRKNLEHYRKLLTQEGDDARHRTILKLLADEEAKDEMPGRAVKDEEPES